MITHTGISKIIFNRTEENIAFSKESIEEMTIMCHLLEEAVVYAKTIVKTKDLKFSIELQAIQDLVEEQKEKYELNHIKRLKNNKCTIEAGIMFLDMLNSCEKILHHAINVSIAMNNFINNENIFTRKEYYKKLLQTEQNNELENRINELKMKYKLA